MIKNILCFISVLLFAGNVYAGPASAKLSALAESLIKGYELKAGVGKAALAVFPFSCEEKLRRQRVGFAVSELMSHRFVANANFTVVERGDLNKLLTEQKLQSSGATDSATAVKLGQMLGASALLMGNLNKVDGLYQVNARIVDVQTGEIVASGYTELPVNAFEDDARVYLNLVPQEQTLGFYGIFNFRHNANDSPTFSQITPSNVYTFNPHALISPMAGGGMLYRPHKHMQINADVSTTKIGKYKYVLFTSSYTGGGGATNFFWTQKRALEMTTVALMASYVDKLAGKWNYSAGAGVQYVFGSVEESKENPPLAPFVKVGMEYKPQSRIGFGLNIKYELKRAIFRSEVSDNVLLKMNPLSFETVLAVYF